MEKFKCCDTDTLSCYLHCSNNLSTLVLHHTWQWMVLHRHFVFFADVQDACTSARDI